MALAYGTHSSIQRCSSVTQIPQHRVLQHTPVRFLDNNGQEIARDEVLLDDGQDVLVAIATDTDIPRLRAHLGLQ